MPQLTLFCKTLQAVDITFEGVLSAYDVTRATLVSYKTDIKHMPFLRRFVESVMSNSCGGFEVDNTCFSELARVSRLCC